MVSIPIETLKTGSTPSQPKEEKGFVLVSIPPKGKCAVMNIYVDPDTGKLVVEYNDDPLDGG